MSTDTYAIPCHKCGYVTPVDSECRRCGTVAKDESRPITNKAPSPYTIIDNLTAENERLREALERIEAARLPWPDEEAQCTDISSLITGMKDIAREALEDSHVRS